MTAADRARFLLEYIDMLLGDGFREEQGFRHVAPGQAPEAASQPARGREKWVINKLRALNSWYTKGLENGSHLRMAINSAGSIAEVRDTIERFFLACPIL